MKRIFSLLLTLCLLIGIFPAAGIISTTAQELEDGYIEAPLDGEITYYENENGATIGVTSSGVIVKDGLYFKDSNGNQELDSYEDWRLSADERASDLVSQMTLDEMSALMVINTKSSTENPSTSDSDIAAGMRYFIDRSNLAPSTTAKSINALQTIAEDSRLGIPVVIASNSRNENNTLAVGFNEASGTFATYPGTLGIAAAQQGDLANDPDDWSLIETFAENARSEWTATGIRKGYMYMADALTDPRWTRSYGTFGEDPDFIYEIMYRLVEGFQGEELSESSVSMTTKHFPGGGARENGFDPHVEDGKFNMYATEGSLETYHLPGFQGAIDAGTTSMMPYYAIPSDESVTQTYQGNVIDFSDQVGFAYNSAILSLLRDDMGFEGYVNSDTGILSSQAFGVEDLTTVERFAYAVNAGTDIISGSSDTTLAKQAVEGGHLEEERVQLSATRLTTEMFELGLFDNPYSDPEYADEVVNTEASWDAAYEAHQKSVVLLKNEDDILPLSSEKMEGKKVYIEVFAKTASTGNTQTEQLRQSLEEDEGFTLTDDYSEADYAILWLQPSAPGNNDTSYYAELTMVENKTVDLIAGGTTEVTTLAGADRLQEIYEDLDSRGAKVITNLNCKMAWSPDGVEEYAHSFLVGFDTFTSATMDVIMGRYNPTGVLPVTLPDNAEVVEVIDGQCVSPNDVSGYDKDQYISDEVLDKTKGGSYAYYDEEGNYYTLGFGLSYTTTSTVTYNVNGEETTVDVSDGQITLPDGKDYTAPDGYYFAGWNTAEDGSGTNYEAGATITITEDTVLYAQWNKVIDFRTDHVAYIVGYDNGDAVKPEENISRAESVTIFFRLFTDDSRSYNWSTENDYSDVNNSLWYNNAISTLTNAGAVDGYDDTDDFKPHYGITRAEFVKLVVSLMGTDSYTIASDFTDISEHWAKELINIAYAQGYIEGDSNSTLFRPDDKITRAEAMTIVNRVLGRDTEIGEYHDDMITWPDNADTTVWYYAAIQEATNSHECETREDGKEYWTAILETPDWEALENQWATANS